MIPTSGALFIVEEAAFDVILGMPWLKDNLGAVVQKSRGSYVQWISGLMRYEVKSYKTEMGKRKDQVKEEKAREVYSEDSSGTPVTSCMARIRGSPPTDQSCVPDSEEERRAPDFLNLEVTSGDEDVEAEVVKWTKDTVTEWSRKWEKADGDADGEDNAEEGRVETKGEEGGVSASPPNQRTQRKRRERSREVEGEHSRQKQKRRRIARTEDEVIEVTEEMEEEFTRKKTDDGDEWNAFLVREGKRRVERNRRWVEWLESSEGEKDEGKGKARMPAELSSDEEETREEDRDKDAYASHTRRTETLGTSSAKTSSPLKRKEPAQVVLTSKEIVARRSQRARKEKVVWEPERTVRTYRSGNKASKTTTTRRRKAASAKGPGSDEGEIRVQAYCVWISKGKRSGDEDKRTKKRASKGERQRAESWDFGARQTPGEVVVERRSQTQSRMLDGVTVSPEITRGRSPEPNEPGADLRDSGEKTEVKSSPEQDEPEQPYLESGKRGNDGNHDDINSSRDDLSIIGPIANLISLEDPEGKDGPTEEKEHRQEKTRPESEVDPTRYEWREKEKEPEREGQRADALETRWVDPSNQQEGTREEEAIPLSDMRILQTLMDNEADDGSPDGCRQFRSEEERGKYLEGIWRQRRESLAGRQADNGVIKVRGWVEGKYAEKGEIPEVGKSRNEDPSIGQTMESRAEFPMRVGRFQRQEDNDIAYVDEAASRPVVPKGLDEKPIRTPRKKGRRSCLPSKSQLRRRFRQSYRKFTKTFSTLHIVPLFFVLVIFWTTFPRNNSPTCPTMLIKEQEPRVDNSQPPDPSLAALIPPYYVPIGPTNPPSHEKDVLKNLSRPEPEQMTKALVAISHLVFSAAESSPNAHGYYGKGVSVSIRYPNKTTRTYRGDIQLRLFARETGDTWNVDGYPSRQDLSVLREIMFEEPGTEGVLESLWEDKRGAFDRIRAGSDGGVQPFPDDPSPQDMEPIEEEEGEEDVEEAEMRKASEELRKAREERVGTFRIGPPASKLGKGIQRGKRTVPLPKVPKGVYETGEETMEEGEKESNTRRAGKEISNQEGRDQSDIASSSEGTPGAERGGKGARTRERVEQEMPPYRQLTAEDVQFLRAMKAAVLKTQCDPALFNALRTKLPSDLANVEKSDRDGDIEMKGRTDTVLDHDYHPSSPALKQVVGPRIVPKTPMEEEIEELREDLKKMRREAEEKAEADARDAAWFTERITALERGGNELDQPAEPDQQARNNQVGPSRQGKKGKENWQRGPPRPVNVAMKTYVKLESRVDSLEHRFRNMESKEEGRERVWKLAKDVEGLKKEAEEGTRRITEIELLTREISVSKDPRRSDGNPGKVIFEEGIITRVSSLEDKGRSAYYRVETLEQYLGWNERVLEALWKTVNAANLVDRFRFTEELRAIWRASSDHFANRQRAMPTPSSILAAPGQSVLRPTASPFITSLGYLSTSTANNPSESY